MASTGEDDTGTDAHTCREASAVFTSAKELQSAIDALLASGFTRDDLSVLGSEKALHAKFGAKMRAYKYISMWAGPPNYNGVCDVEDYATGLVRFGRKVTMSFEIAWAANTEPSSYIELLGDKGGVRAMDGKPLKIATEYEGRLADITPQFNANINQFQVQAAKFLAACRGECPPAATAAEGLTLMRLMDGVYKSAKTGQEVKLS